MGPGPWTEGEDREGEASERTTMLSSRSGIERERERKVRGKSSSKQTTAVGRSGLIAPDCCLIAWYIYDIGVRYKY